MGKNLEKADIFAFEISSIWFERDNFLISSKSCMNSSYKTVSLKRIINYSRVLTLAIVFNKRTQLEIF